MKFRIYLSYFLLFLPLMPGYITAAPSLWEKAVIFVKEHPYLTAGAAAVGVGCFYACKAYCAAQNRAKLAKSEAEKNTSFLKSFLNSEQLNLPLTSGDLDRIITLLKNGADPNTKGKQGTVLTLISQMQDDNNEAGQKIVEICDLLIKCRANLNTQGPLNNGYNWRFYDMEQNREYPALWLAAYANNWCVLEFLLKYGADANKTMFNDERTLLMRAIEYSKLELFNFLLNNMVDPNYTINGNSALIVAIKSTRGEPFLKILLKRGVDPNSKFYKGQTPIMTTIYHCSGSQQEINSKLNMIKLLLDFGADVSAKNSQGQSVLDIAIAQKGNPQILNLISQYSAYNNFKILENDAQSYVSLLPRDVKNMTSNYILPK